MTVGRLAGNIVNPARCVLTNLEGTVTSPQEAIFSINPEEKTRQMAVIFGTCVQASVHTAVPVPFSDTESDKIYKYIDIAAETNEAVRFLNGIGYVYERYEMQVWPSTANAALTIHTGYGSASDGGYFSSICMPYS